jgi:subtilisin-like proprotein convertase family protein
MFQTSELKNLMQTVRGIMTIKKSLLSALLVVAALGTVLSGATVLVRSQKMKRSAAAGQGVAQPRPSKRLASPKLLPAAALAQTCNTVSNVTTCTENTSITIPTGPNPPGGDPNNGAPASPYPSNIVLSGVAGTINKVTVKLNNLSHTSADDLDMMLVGPNGNNVFFWSDSGGTSTVISNSTYTIDDSATSSLPDGPPIPAGTYKPTNNASTNNGGNNDHFPSPAPTPSALTSFGAAFNGISPNGTWSLYITDDATGDVGTMSGGWTLEVTVGAAAAPTTTTVTSSQPDFSLSGSAVTFTATVVKTSDSSSVGANGTVTFKDGATNLTCTEGGQPRPLNVSGQATCTTSALSIGNHTINADYSGTAAFLTSSGSTTQVVDGPTTNPVANEYCNTASIAIPQSGGTSGVASPYSSHISVTGLTGNISKVTVELKNFSHSIPDDVDMLLVSPTGQNLVIMSDVGGTTAASNVNLTLDDAAAASLPDGGPLASGTFKPTNAAGTGTEAYPAPAPAPSANTTLASAFNGISPNGVWRLYIVDDAGGDVGALAGGWCLNFITTTDVGTTTTVTSSQPDFSTSGQSVTFTATVTRNDTNAPVTSGTVTFKEGATVLSGPTALNGSGQASFSTSSLAVGNHTITAEYSGVPGQFNLSSGQFVQVVDNPTTQTGNEFCNTGTINVPATGQGAISGATAAPYPSHITVSGMSGTVTNVTVEINNFTHTNPDDVDILLVSPTGQNIVLMSDVGGATDVSNISLTLDDAAAASLPDSTALSSGTFKPTNIGGGDPYPAPAPAPSANTTLASAFNGISPNGVWRLYIVDDAGGDVGTIGQWCLTITTPTSISISDASLAEPTSGSANMTFTVLASPAPSTGMDVTFTTENDPLGPNPATAGSDYTPTSGTLHFDAGQSLQTISVPILADGVAGEPNETFIVHLTGVTGAPGASITDDKATGTITPPGSAPAAQLLISELRTSGPTSVDNDFVEIYNNSNAQFTIPAGGYGLFKTGAACSDTPVLIGTIPAGTPIPARGHFLFVGSAYSLGSYAAGNQTLLSNIESDRSVALFSTATLANLASATKIDAVGFGTTGGNNCDLLSEGSRVSDTGGSTSEYSVVRHMETGFNQDTNNNASDFYVVSTTPGVAVGSTPQPVLGAPGPENLTSPLLRTSTVKSVLLDPAQPVSSPPNRVRTQRASCPSCDNTKSNAGTLEIRRTFVNNTGASVTRLRFRIVDVTTLNNRVPATDADLRALNATGSFPVTVTGGGSVTVQSLTLEAPSDAVTNGGGMNSTLAAGTVTITPLAPSDSINVNFLLGVQVSGNFRFFVIVEALP